MDVLIAFVLVWEADKCFSLSLGVVLMEISDVHRKVNVELEENVSVFFYFLSACLFFAVNTFLGWPKAHSNTPKQEIAICNLVTCQTSPFS